MTKEIELTQGKVALIDDVDYPLISQYKWHAVAAPNTYYAAYTVNRPSKNTKSRQTSKKIFMHRLILGLKEGEKGDHVDGNGCNNKRDNVRKATNQENGFNRKKTVVYDKRVCTSHHKGVCWHSRDKIWTAYIGFNKKVINIGYFINELDAARAYDAKARELFGEFARLNFPAASP